MSAYGEVHGSDDVEDAVVQRLRDWLPHFIPWVCEQKGIDPKKLPVPKGVIAVSDLDWWPEETLPVVLVESTGTATDPEKDSDGDYTAEYRITIAVVTQARDEGGTRRAAQLYNSAILAAMVKKPRLNEHVSVTSWNGDDLTPGQVDERRTLFIGANSFTVELRNVINWLKAPAPTWVPDEPPIPAEPPTDPTQMPDDRPTIASVEINTEESAQ